MDWKPVFEIAYRVLECALVFVVLPGLAILLLFGRIGNREPARVLRDGARIELPTCRVAFWSWILVIAFLVQAFVRRLIRAHLGPLDLLTEGVFALGALSLLSMLPATIVVTEEGLEQVFWLGRNRRIRWENIEEVDTGNKGQTVSIKAVDGTTIRHTGQQVDRPRLLLELKQRCGEDLPPDFPREPRKYE
jgi:hypothetical protein